MKACYAYVLVLGMVCVSAPGQTVFMSPQPGAGVDLTDPLHPTVLAGHSLKVEILMDATVTTAPKVGAVDMRLRVTDVGGTNRGRMECGGYVVDTNRADLLLESCNFCPARCHPHAFAVAGLLDNAEPWHDVDFVAYIATLTVRPTPDAKGEWLLTYAREMSHVVIGGLTGVIVDISSNPDSFIPLPISVIPAPYIVHGEGMIGETRPMSGYIDPRHEKKDPDSNRAERTHFTLLFNEPVFSVGGGPLSPSNFVVTDTGGGTHVVQSVASTNNPKVVITLSEPPPMLEWITIKAVVENAAGAPVPDQGDLGYDDEPDRLDLAYLPGDFDQTGAVGPRDLSKCRKIISRTIKMDVGAIEDYADTNQDGRITPTDLTAFRELAFGYADAGEPWKESSLNNARP